jgi:hypothetical protein
MAVPLFDTSAPLRPLREELRQAIERVLERERYILGPEVEAFEREFAAYCGAEHAVGVANGTDAITIALRAMGVGPGDEVVVPSFTFYASVEAIQPTGATPVFCDIDPHSYCVTAETVRAALTPRSKAVIAVHLFGNVAPVGEIAALGVPVLEDAAQAAGSRSAPRPRSPSTPPRTSPASVTAGRSSPPTARSPSRPGCCASTARATRSATRRSATTRGWTSSRRRSYAFSYRIWTSGPAVAATRSAAIATPGSASWPSCRARSRGWRPRGTSLRSLTRKSTACRQRW